MQKHDISTTFCPAKWDELVVNQTAGYTHACCKATPIKFYGDYKSIIRLQKQNLLNNIKDKSCNYCWEIEKTNNKSLRHEHLSRFNFENYHLYYNLDKPVKILEINLGNSCNLQCMYCNPKFSSEWAKDVKKKIYPVFTDRHVYQIETKSTKTLQKNIEMLDSEQFEIIRILGGEPLINKNLWFILDNYLAEKVFITTNFTIDKTTLDKLLSYETKFKELKVNVSLDSDSDLTDIVRYGTKYQTIIDNVNYYLKNATSNKLLFNSVMTCLTVLDIEKIYKVILDLRSNYTKDIRWALNNCVSPKFQSFSSLPDNQRTSLIKFCKNLNDPLVTGVDTIISALENTKFDPGLHKQLQYFVTEWENRKQIILPKRYKDMLCLN